MAKARPDEYGSPPSIATIEAMAERAFAEIPAGLRKHVRGVGITVREAADRATLRQLGLRSPWQLAGLYRGTPLPLRSVEDISRPPDLIFLYREAILLEWIETGADLYELVRNVLIHEIAHHFGFSDANIAALENE